MRLPSPAMIVALLALIVALSGTSYAVTQLPRDSVGPVQLQDDAVDSSKIKDYSLRIRDFRNELPRGEQGDRGPRGLQGATGPQGPAGIQGAAGRTGATGVQGATGEQGLTGSTGQQGAKGDPGIPGAKGDPGDQGIPGPKGDTGEQGVPGPKGDTGEQGVPGPKGDTGDQGIPGPKGDTGLTGAPGAKGDTGATGPRGPSNAYIRSGTNPTFSSGTLAIMIVPSGSYILMATVTRTYGGQLMECEVRKFDDTVVTRSYDVSATAMIIPFTTQSPQGLKLVCNNDGIIGNWTLAAIEVETLTTS